LYSSYAGIPRVVMPSYLLRPSNRLPDCPAPWGAPTGRTVHIRVLLCTNTCLRARGTVHSNRKLGGDSQSRNKRDDRFHYLLGKFSHSLLSCPGSGYSVISPPASPQEAQFPPPSGS